MKNGQFKIVRIKVKNPSITMWQAFKNYINSIEDGVEFSRSDMLKKLYDKDTALALSGGGMNSIDTYRNRCTVGGFLKSSGFGKYVKLHNIPENLSITLLVKIVRGFTDEEWKEWFIPAEQRVEIIKEACLNK